MSGSVRDISDREAARLDQLNYGNERDAIVRFRSPHTLPKRRFLTLPAPK
jgi:hypothetical protein